MTLGSLFDGIGGWPLAAIHADVEPVWCSEIESFPQTVTKRHFPKMEQLGDITKIDGTQIAPVDIVTIGSPCQDLSIAGKRKGLNGERSGLFRTAIDIVRAMRRANGKTYPDLSFGRTCPGHSARTREMIFELCLKKSQRASFQCLNLEDGQRPEWSEAMAVKSLGGPWTPNIGECPSVVRESFLSQILEVNVPQKYYLSPKACAGILRRATARGKDLPGALREALIRQA